MAKYTELFAEYRAKGNSLPSIFSEIDGFADLFDAYYCDKEIGFETEYLFGIKLEMYAQLNVPHFKKLIEIQTHALAQAKDPEKLRVTDYEFNKGKVTRQYGEKVNKQKDLPMDSVSANESFVSTDAQHTDTESSLKDEATTEVTETGMTPDEALRFMETLNKNIKDLKQALLDSFKPCFMQVY